MEAWVPSPSCTFSASFLSKRYSRDPVSYFLMHFPPRGLGTSATFQDHLLIPSCQLILKCLIEDTKKITVEVRIDLILTRQMSGKRTVLYFCQETNLALSHAFQIFKILICFHDLSFFS